MPIKQEKMNTQISTKTEQNKGSIKNSFSTILTLLNINYFSVFHNYSGFSSQSFLMAMRY